MLALYLLAYLGGVLTIVSPCVLPVLPLILSRADRPWLREGLPLLTGLGIVFAAIATLGTVGGSRLASANAVGRWIALAALSAIGLALLTSGAAVPLARPFVAFGSWLERRAERYPPRLRALLTGGAIGFVWAPCAGPILGLLIAGAALRGVDAQTALIFLMFAAGACTSLAVALYAGGRFAGTLRRSFGAGESLRRIMGGALLAGVLLIASGLDRKLFAGGSLVRAAQAEDALVNRLSPARSSTAEGRAPGGSLDDFLAEERAASLPDEGAAPDFSGGTGWINSSPLSIDSLRGKVVLVDFWTFACYNCLNALPHVKALYARYRDQGFVVVGVHTPEFPFERVPGNVAREVRRLGVSYPVVLDNDYRIWNAFHNQYWPAAYFVDASGRVRFHHFGEGRYEEQDRVVAKLLAEARAAQ